MNSTTRSSSGRFLVSVVKEAIAWWRKLLAGSAGRRARLPVPPQEWKRVMRRRRPHPRIDVEARRVPTPEPVPEAIPKPRPEPAGELGPQPTHPPGRTPGPEPIEASGPGPVGEPVAEPAQTPIAAPEREPDPEPTREPAPEPIRASAPEPAPEPAAEPRPEPRPEPGGKPFVRAGFRIRRQPGAFSFRAKRIFIPPNSIEIDGDAAHRVREAYATFYHDLHSLDSRTGARARELYARALQAAWAGDGAASDAQREYARLNAEYARAAQQIYQSWHETLRSIATGAYAAGSGFR